ncbi:MAG: DUF5011 domain-containing protein, partial [Mariprofundus sp.]
ITLNGVASVTIAQGTVYTDAGATALDTVDGNITAKIVTVNPVNTASSGTYIVSYSVSDAAGNAAIIVNRTVIVSPVDTVAPVITLNGVASVTIAQGTVYTDAGATALDTVDGDITAKIVTVNPINTTLLGVYIVTYNISDAAGNAAVEISRIVQVVVDSRPVITLKGAVAVAVVQGTVYTDSGATAIDNVDGIVTANIIVVNTVNTVVAGTYTVTYDVTDAAGNVAVQLVRTVYVIAPGLPSAAGMAIQMPIGGSSVSVEIASGNEVISSFSAVAASGTPPAGVTTPFGVLSYSTTVPVGSVTQKVNLAFNTPLPVSFELYKVGRGGVYSLIPNGPGVDQWTQLNATTIALTLSDGGQFDLDGAVNGVIVDPVAVGIAGKSSSPVLSGGGCAFAVQQASPVDPVLPALVLLSMLWLTMRCKKDE